MAVKEVQLRSISRITVWNQSMLREEISGFSTFDASCLFLYHAQQTLLNNKISYILKIPFLSVENNYDLFRVQIHICTYNLQKKKGGGGREQRSFLTFLTILFSHWLIIYNLLKWDQNLENQKAWSSGVWETLEKSGAMLKDIITFYNLTWIKIL